ncbi:MAG: 4-phosphopantetheinyl transferase [Ramlibacter sp.]|nr:4-phosphopantetheinyl transferase [Ramlibacter sp.]
MTELPFIELRSIRLGPGRSLGLVTDARREAVRAVLAHLISCAPEAVRIERTPQGKPYLGSADPVAFNVSHAGAYSLLAVSRGAMIGCDIEDRFRDEDADQGFASILNPAEVEAMNRLDPNERQDAFKRYWVRKEAALKAVGTGFLNDPRGLIVGLDDSHARWAGQDFPPLNLHNRQVDSACFAAIASMDASCSWYQLAA